MSIPAHPGGYGEVVLVANPSWHEEFICARCFRVLNDIDIARQNFEGCHYVGSPVNQAAQGDDDGAVELRAI